MTVVHKNLTGADLHEPKGAATALSGQVYVSDGAGSGVWTTASSIVTNTAFTTGDLKLTHKTTADTSWILWSDGTIGDGSSGATIRANADTADLFALYWPDTRNTVSTGRGVSAVADFAAHKTLALPKGAGRAIGLAGTGSGLTSRTLGDTVGAETVTLAANQIPSLTSSGSNSISVTSTTPRTATGTIQSANVTGGADKVFTANGVNEAIASSGTNTISVAYTNSSIQTVPNIPPTSFVNIMIKL